MGKLKFFDLFAGVGGFRLGMERAGHECVGACEWDEKARETYNKNFGHYPEYNDVKDLQPYTLPQFDVLCAGFPCQSFSVCGKRMGFNDTRGTMFFEIARIAKVKRPQFLFLENVKGLLYHDKGNTFRTILSTLDELGYDVEWQVFDSKYFVPQRRERTFIIGHLRGGSTRRIFPLGDYDKEIPGKELKQIGNIDTKGHNSIWGRVYDTILAPTLNAEGGGLGAKTGIFAVSFENTKANGRRIKDDGDPSFCLSTAGHIGILKDRRLRVLTPTECERLQGFPDNWTIGKKTHRKKQMGNAVTVDVVEYIARELRIG